MHLKPYISPNSVVTMADGSHKNITEVKVGDEVQTYDMSTEEFDCANIHVNEQVSTKVSRITTIEVNPNETVEVKLSPKKVWVDGMADTEDGDWENEEDSTSNTVIFHGQTAVMGGTNLGWLVGNLETVIKTSPTDEPEEELRQKFGSIEAGVEIQMDYGDSTTMRQVESVEKRSGDDVELFYMVVLESGDSIFVDDVMVGVNKVEEDDSFYHMNV